MAVTTVTISTADLGLTAAATPVVITLVSNKPYIFDTTNGDDIQRTKSTTTLSDGTLSVGVDANSHLSDTASTYTFTIGGNVYSGVVVPAAGPVTLISLLPAVVVTTVTVTYTSLDPGGAPEQSETITAQLSVDCVDSHGNIIYASTVKFSTSDSSGNGSLPLIRTDQLTIPGSAGVEPYYTFKVGINTYYKYVRAGGGVLTALTDAVPASVTGGFGATPAQITHTADVPPPAGGPEPTPVTLSDDLENLVYLDTLRLRYRGAWNSGTAFVANDVTVLAGSFYICTAPNTNQAPPNGAYWIAVSATLPAAVSSAALLQAAATFR